MAALREVSFPGIFFLSFLGLSPCFAGQKPGGKGPGPCLVSLEFRNLDSRDLRAQVSGFSFYQYLDLSSGKAVWDFGRAGGKTTFLRKGRRVYIDRDGDGKVGPGDGPPLGEEAVLEGSLAFKGRRLAYPVHLRVEGGYLLLYPKVCLAGRLGRYEFLFVDSNLDGRFFQFGVDRMILVELVEKGKGTPREKGKVFPGPYPLSRVVSLGKNLYVLDPLEGGDLKLYPYPARTALLQVRGFEGCRGTLRIVLGDAARDLYFQLLEPGDYLLPRREYRVVSASLDFQTRPPRPGGKGAARLPAGGRPRPWSFSLLGAPAAEQPRVDLRGGPVVLDAGPPFRLGFDALVWGRKGNRLEVSNVYLESPSGLRFQAEVLGRDDTQSIQVYLRGGGKKRFLAKLEYG